MTVGWFQSFSKSLAKVRPKSKIDHLRPYLPPKYSPLRNTGEGLQSVYLAAVPKNLAKELISLLGEQYHVALSGLENAEVEFVEEALEESIKGRTDIGATEIEQLIKARRGQGIFKENVRLNETICRVTGISDPKHLRASHIKPWSRSTDAEKLNGCNGLLLSPHIDHLFDKGFISFTDGGDLLLSPHLNSLVVAAWGIPQRKNVGSFNDQQKTFLEFHRESVFKE